MEKLQVDVNDVIGELSAQIANLSRENAILKSQLKAVTKDNEEPSNTTENAIQPNAE